MILNDLPIYISSNSRNILLLENIFLYVISWFGGDFGIQIWFHLNILVESPSIVPHHGNDFAKCQIIFHHGKNILPCSYWFWYDFINLKIYLLILVESFHHLTQYILIFKIFRLERWLKSFNQRMRGWFVLKFARRNCWGVVSERNTAGWEEIWSIQWGTQTTILFYLKV